MGAACGYLNVPVDRKHPNKGGTIPINFELYLHSASGPAQSVLIPNFGGPGSATAANRGYAFYVFANNLDVHDLLLIDDRGRGLSGTIGVANCMAIQHGTEPWDQSMPDCAAQLGIADSMYATADIAEDIDAVRAALGYDKVDYFGWSYGGADVSAYATRFGSHLRSIILDSPYGAPDLNQFQFNKYRADSQSSMVSLACLRSPTCAPDHPDPLAEIRNLITSVRSHPPEGNAYDANGNLKHVIVDEDSLLNFVFANMTGNFASTGEVLAAAKSFAQGDPAPLLRLDAEASYPEVGDSGDPTSFSVGAQYATACADNTEAWNWASSFADREAQYEQAVTELPANYYAPFSNAVATAFNFSWFGKECMWWDLNTAPAPLTPASTKYPSVPTLVFSGDMDNRVPVASTSKLAALFPDSTFVKVAEVGHGSVFWSSCAANLASNFFESLNVGDLACTQTPETVWPAVGRFPLLAQYAVPAAIDTSGTNQIGLAERKVVTVSVAATTDAMQRSMIGYGDGVGLRAGTSQTAYSSSAWTTTLTNCAFATDVTVNGTVTWDIYGSFVADLTVSGSGTSGGTLHVAGTWQAPGPVGNFEVTGTLGGKGVAVLVPEA